MRIYASAYELMSETGRNLWEMGSEVKPKTYQNKIIEGDENFITRELICTQYCLTSMKDEEFLFVYDKRSVEWTRKEFEERILKPVLTLNKVIYINPGEAYKLRLDLWDDLMERSQTLRFDYTYNERIMFRPYLTNFGDYHGSNLDSVIELLKNDKDTRKAVLPIFSLNDVAFNDGSKRIPCSMYYDFLIRDVNGVPQLNICYHQRSADFVSHFGNDVWLAWALMQYVASVVGVKPGYLYHTIDSLHSYKRDWDKLKWSLNEIY